MSQTPMNLPDFGQIVFALAEGAQTIMESLYNLQMILHEPQTPMFAPVRKELRDQCEDMESYLRKCHGFGVDVLTLKDLVQTEAKEDLVDFLEEMRVSSASLRDSSRELMDRDMSAVFSNNIKLSVTVKIRNYFSNTPRNTNLKTFITAVGGPKNVKAVLTIDQTFLITQSNLQSAFKFWDIIFTQCSTLIEQFESGRLRMAAKDTNRMASDWRYYQQAIEKAIVSFTMTKDAILVEVDAHIPAATFLRLVQLGWEVERR